jgi:hypothetical protein
MRLRFIVAIPLLLPLSVACGDSTGTSADTTNNATPATPATTTDDPPDPTTAGSASATMTEDSGSATMVVSGTTTSSTGPDVTSSTSTSSTATTMGVDTDHTKYDVGSMETGDDTGVDCRPGGDATVEGTVYAPNLVIPVSGALVYASAEPPEGVPNEVYCADCVDLPCATGYVLTNADGSFSLPVQSGMKYIVVQKGQFLRATEIDVVPGVNALGVDVTSLPDHRDEANHLYIPNIAIGLGSYDRLEDAMGKLGLADTLIDMNSYTEQFVPGTEQFDMWENGYTELPSMGTMAELVNDYEKLKKYHILFVPCSDDPYIDAMYSDIGKENIRKWVEEGGKFYVADWSNEYLFAGFGQYQKFYTNQFGGGTDLSPPYDSLGTVLDPDMLAWLEALPAALKDINPANGGFTDHPAIDSLPQLLTVDNWSGVEATPEILVDDGMGGQVNVGHKTWIEGPGDGENVPLTPEPLTITGQYGCGKIMFTTYHMAEFNDTYIGLTPQELVLLYLILEIGVCQQDLPPPQ